MNKSRTVKPSAALLKLLEGAQETRAMLEREGADEVIQVLNAWAEMEPNNRDEIITMAEIITGKRNL